MPGGPGGQGGVAGTVARWLIDDRSAPDVEALQHSVEELAGGERALREAETVGSRTRGHAGGGSPRGCCVVLACLLAVVSVFVVFARNQLLNTDTYVSTVAPLATNPAIQTQVATRVSDELIAADRPGAAGQERAAGQGRVPGHAHHRRGAERHLLRSP